jgi:hypothetical protein
MHVCGLSLAKNKPESICTCLSVRERHFRTTSPSSARRSSVLRNSAKYLANRVWPCLLTISKNFIMVTC